MGNKGFTLIELIATIVVLALIMSIGAYSIVGIINGSRRKNYELLINNIKTATETYSIECKYASNTGITCNNPITLGNLVIYGYLTGNGKDSLTGEYILINPNDNNPIGDCLISYTYDNGKISISAINPSGSCPTEY